MSSLRIIAGSAKGRKLRTVPGDSTRPITDRVKESLFNILGADVVDSTWLDMFGGTGAVGIEAISRGAKFVRFMDTGRLAVKTIGDNLTHTGFEQQAEVLQGNAFVMIGKISDRTFDYIYIAPPQYHELWEQALQAVDARPDWLSDDAWVIVQIHPREYKSLDLTHLELIDQRKYGSTLLVFYERNHK